MGERAEVDKSADVCIWSDDWWIEDNEAWFTGMDINAVFHYDFTTGKCRFIARIPDKRLQAYREYSRCVKYGNEIYCIPYNGKSIWVYSLEEKLFQEVVVDNPEQKPVKCMKYLKTGDSLYVISHGLNQIIEIDLKNKVIGNYYNIPFGEAEEIGINSIIGNVIYIISSNNLRIYQFDCAAKEFIIEELPYIDDALFTVYYLDNKYWLSGNKKKVYIWDKLNRELKILDRFPKSFGFYNFEKKYSKIVNNKIAESESHIFVDIIPLENYMWCIPYQANNIIRINIETFEAFSFEIDNEDETQSSLDNRVVKYKYLIEYVRKNRYIGLYSVKNEEIIEIDCKKLSCKRLKYILDDNYFKLFGGIPIFENRKMSSLLFCRKRTMLKVNETDNTRKSIGNEIYYKMKESKN